MDPCLLIVAAFSRHAEGLAWAREVLEQDFGPVGIPGPIIEFKQTRYYEATMGPGLRKAFLAFRDLVPADALPRIKRRTIERESELARTGRFAEPRPLNLDPGLLTLGKFQLATTKDQAHRIYLSDGILAEVTLRFQDGSYRAWPWTYADYQLPEVIAFLNQARADYRRRQPSGSAPKEVSGLPP